MGHFSRGCAAAAALVLGIQLAGSAGAFSPRGGASPAAGPAALPVSPTAPLQPDTTLAEALRRLEASDTVWKRNDTDFRRQRAAGALSGAEAEAFAAYVAELKVQLLVDCAAARRLGGGRELERFDCEAPEEQAASGPVAALPPDPETAKTGEEAAASLDDELRRIEGELDELTRRKAEAARQSASLPAGGGGANGQGGGSGVNGRSDAEGAERDGGSWKDPGDGAPSPEGSPPGEGIGEKRGEKRDEKPGGGVAESAPRRDPGGGPGAEEPKKETAKADRGRIESGDDDDVVARQLREAAERETDPALKEKLWAEYRKYKAAQR